MHDILILLKILNKQKKEIPYRHLFSVSVIVFLNNYATSIKEIVPSELPTI